MKLKQAVENYVRFDMVNEKGEKRRELYDRLGADGAVNKETGEPLAAPEIEIPKDCEEHWRVYFDVSNSLSRVKEGECHHIPPSEWLAWSTLTGVRLNYEIMRMMDNAFVGSMNRELEERRERNRPTK